jgi:hypothetical protein
MISKSELFWEEYMESFTDDLPFLRYSGPVKLFVYGRLATDFDYFTEFLRKKNLKLVEDVVTYSYRAETSNKYLPIKAPDKDMMFCPLINTEDKLLTSKRVRGKLLSCSLKAIRAFDEHFNNTLSCQRTLIKLKPPGYKGTEEAYTYIFKNHVGFYSDGAQWSLKDPQFKRFIIETSNDGVVYV